MPSTGYLLIDLWSWKQDASAYWIVLPILLWSNLMISWPPISISWTSLSKVSQPVRHLFWIWSSRTRLSRESSWYPTTLRKSHSSIIYWPLNSYTTYLEYCSPSKCWSWNSKTTSISRRLSLPLEPSCSTSLKVKTSLCSIWTSWHKIT